MLNTSQPSPKNAETPPEMKISQKKLSNDKLQQETQHATQLETQHATQLETQHETQHETQRETQREQNGKIVINPSTTTTPKLISRANILPRRILQKPGSQTALNQVQQLEVVDNSQKRKRLKELGLDCISPGLPSTKIDNQTYKSLKNIVKEQFQLIKDKSGASLLTGNATSLPSSSSSLLSSSSLSNAKVVTEGENKEIQTSSNEVNTKNNTEDEDMKVQENSTDAEEKNTEEEEEGEEEEEEVEEGEGEEGEGEKEQEEGEEREEGGKDNENTDCDQDDEGLNGEGLDEPKETNEQQQQAPAQHEHVFANDDQNNHGPPAATPSSSTPLRFKFFPSSTNHKSLKRRKIPPPLNIHQPNYTTENAAAPSNLGPSASEDSHAENCDTKANNPLKSAKLGKKSRKVTKPATAAKATVRYAGYTPKTLNTTASTNGAQNMFSTQQPNQPRSQAPNSFPPPPLTSLYQIPHPYASVNHPLSATIASAAINPYHLSNTNDSHPSNVTPSAVPPESENAEKNVSPGNEPHFQAYQSYMQQQAMFAATPYSTLPYNPLFSTAMPHLPYQQQQQQQQQQMMMLHGSGQLPLYYGSPVVSQQMLYPGQATAFNNGGLLTGGVPNLGLYPPQFSATYPVAQQESLPLQRGPNVSEASLEAAKHHKNKGKVTDRTTTLGKKPQDSEKLGGLIHSENISGHVQVLEDRFEFEFESGADELQGKNRDEICKLNKRKFLKICEKIWDESYWLLQKRLQYSNPTPTGLQEKHMLVHKKCSNGETEGCGAKTDPSNSTSDSDEDVAESTRSPSAQSVSGSKSPSKSLEDISSTPSEKEAVSNAAAKDETEHKNPTMEIKGFRTLTQKDYGTTKSSTSQ